MFRRPLFPLHRSTGMKTFFAGRNPVGRTNGSAFVPLVAIAPLKCTIPEMVRTAAFDVPKGAFVQPFWSASAVNDVGDNANEAPSSEVPHCTIQKLLVPSGCTVTAPLGAMFRRPMLPVQRLIRA